MLNAQFFDTVAALSGLPGDSLYEVAFAGRSNAGKSSAINAITNQRRLAFVSKTPGRTQHLNFFTVGAQRFLVDLPGYGYARAPLMQQLGWQSLIGGYLHDRPQLRGLVLIMDIRHPFTELDQQLLDWFLPFGRPVHVLLSKSDKLSRGQALPVFRRAKEHLRAWGDQVSVQLFSSTRRVGLEELEAVLRGWLDWPKKSPAQGERPGQ